MQNRRQWEECAFGGGDDSTSEGYGITPCHWKFSARCRVKSLIWPAQPPLFCLFLTTCNITFASPTAQERCRGSSLLSSGDAGRNTTACWRARASAWGPGRSQPAKYAQLTGHHWLVGKWEIGDERSDYTRAVWKVTVKKSVTRNSQETSGPSHTGTVQHTFIPVSWTDCVGWNDYTFHLKYK